MPVRKQYAPPRQTAKLKELINCPMPDMDIYRQNNRRKVDARRRLQDHLLERQIKAESGDR